MALECPECDSRSVEVAASMDLGPDQDSDETAIQLVFCRSCGLRGIGWYEESRRGSRDSWHHYFYRVDEATLERCSEAILGCAQASTPSCRCAAHTRMRRLVASGRHRGNP